MEPVYMPVSIPVYDERDNFVVHVPLSQASSLALLVRVLRRFFNIAPGFNLYLRTKRMTPSRSLSSVHTYVPANSRTVASLIRELVEDNLHLQVVVRRCASRSAGDSDSDSDVSISSSDSDSEYASEIDTDSD